MLIKHTQNGTKGLFFVGEENNHLAEMTYKISDDGTMIIKHTEVSDVLRGKNVGSRLVHTAVEYARANNIKIIPECPFADAVFKKKADYSDVLF